MQIKFFQRIYIFQTQSLMWSQGFFYWASVVYIQQLPAFGLFRSWPYLSAGIGIAAVITAFQMKVQFHPFLFALFLIVGLFQVSVASYVAFVSKKRSSTETG